MKTQSQIATEIETIIPADLMKKFSHLSYAEMAERPELEEYRDTLLKAESDWFAASDLG